MYGPNPSGEPAGERELRGTATVLASPAVTPGTAGPVGWDRCRSAGLVELTRTGPRVTSSRRRAAHPGGEPLTGALDAAVGGCLADLTAGLDEPAGPAVAVQSVLVTATGDSAGAPVSPRALVRVESVAGPLVAGGSGADAAVTVLDAVAGLRRLAPRPVRPPAGWTERPLLLRPPVAAVVVTGACLALASASAVRLDGRRVLPGLTLRDEPVDHLVRGHDDAGHRADVLTLVDRGRVALPERDADTAVPLGRAQWDHDSGALVRAPLRRLALTGPPAPDGGGEPLELAWCVEGLRRYHPDGTLRMLCLARPEPGSPDWFLVSVTAPPLTLLRAVSGVTGPVTGTYSEGEVRSPGLLLPSVERLDHNEGKTRVVVTAI